MAMCGFGIEQLAKRSGPGCLETHRSNLFDYLKNLFTRLPAAKITQIKEFTPTAWAKTKANEQVVAYAA